MKVLLIYPNVRSGYGEIENIPLGYAYLTAALKKSGHRVRIADTRIDNHSPLDEIRIFKPRLIGLTSMTYGFNIVNDLAKLIKQEDAHLPIVVGGIHPTLCSKEILETGNFDFVVKGEGEITLPDLCRALEEKSSIDDVLGIAFRRDGKIIINEERQPIGNLDSLPFPDYSELNLSRYWGTFAVMTSRGCPYSCIYCSTKKVFGSKFRARSAENVVSEIEMLINKYGAHKFQFSDDNFSFDAERAYRICELIVERGLNIKWNVSQGIRADNVTYELASKMKEAGCTIVGIGVESADDRIMKSLKRGTNLRRVTRAIEESKKAGLAVKAFFLIGCPGETFANTARNIDYFKKMNIDAPRCSILTPYPGTELWEWVKENKLMSKDFIPEIHAAPAIVGDLKNPIPFETKEFPKEDRIKAYNLFLGEMEKQLIGKWIEKKLKCLAPLLTIWFNLRFARRLARWSYKKWLRRVIDFG